MVGLFFAGGGGGIRTRGTRERTLDFESSAFNRTQPPHQTIETWLNAVAPADSHYPANPCPSKKTEGAAKAPPPQNMKNPTASGRITYP